MYKTQDSDAELNKRWSLQQYNEYIYVRITFEFKPKLTIAKTAISLAKAECTRTDEAFRNVVGSQVRSQVHMRN
jgi:hypothetical protein